MNILNIGINNIANIYIDSLKENNSRIKISMLEACGASVMLMKGVSELDWKFYSSKIEGFEYDDLVNMPAYHSINLIYTHTGKFYNFLTQLPKPV